MPFRFCVAALVTVPVLIAPASGHATPPAAEPAVFVHVGVTLVPPVPRSRRQLNAMMQEVEAVWRPYGVALLWLTPCARASTSPPDVRLQVEFVGHARQKYPTRHPGPGVARLGAIGFLEGGVPDDIVKLSADEITAVMVPTLYGNGMESQPQATIDDLVGRALGRVLAHELGHYLLALPTHTQDGLMRASFRGHDLAHRDRQAFRLDAFAFVRLQARLTEIRGMPEGNLRGGKPITFFNQLHRNSTVVPEVRGR